VSRGPVYWKPKYATRRMRERAFAGAELERERLLRTADPEGRRSFVSRLVARFR
jgi:hypothetical protein